MKKLVVSATSLIAFVTLTLWLTNKPETLVTLGDSVVAKQELYDGFLHAADSNEAGVIVWQSYTNKQFMIYTKDGNLIVETNDETFTYPLPQGAFIPPMSYQAKVSDSRVFMFNVSPVEFYSMYKLGQRIVVLTGTTPSV